MIKVLAGLLAVIAGLGWGLYVQIGKTAETQAALKIFQTQLAVQLEENQRVNTLLIENQKEAHDTRLKTQSKEAIKNEITQSRPKDDCVNSDVPDELWVLFN